MQDLLAAMDAANPNLRRYAVKRRNLLKTLLAATLVCASVSFAGDAAVLKGNPNSKKYHKQTCRHYAAKGSTVEFKSEEEAKEAGYKPCKQCHKEATETKAAEKTEE